MQSLWCAVGKVLQVPKRAPSKKYQLDVRCQKPLMVHTFGFSIKPGRLSACISIPRIWKKVIAAFGWATGILFENFGDNFFTEERPSSDRLRKLEQQGDVQWFASDNFDVDHGCQHRKKARKVPVAGLNFQRVILMVSPLTPVKQEIFHITSVSRQVTEFPEVDATLESDTPKGESWMDYERLNTSMHEALTMFTL